METFELKQTLLRQRCLTCNEEFPPDSDLKSCPVDATMLSPVFDDPFIGTVIDGKYEVLERIAIGAKAKIYKAKHLHLDKFVALKVLQVGIAVTQAQVARFQKEAQVAVRLIHPNIVRVYDYGTHPQPYIVMEHVDGKTLADLIKESGALPAQRALPYFVQIANAMCAAHASGLVHRDLKPSNVIIDSESGQAKVLDFGLVKDFIDDAHYTKTGDIVGSPSYMSPEQWKGQSLDGRSDIYSLGCLMYEVLTGLAPFAAANPVECMFKHLETKPPKLNKARRDLKFPPGLDVIVRNCLVKDKNNRYRSMTELTKDLLTVQAGKGRKLRPHDQFKTFRLFIGGWLALQVLLFSLCILALAYQYWTRPQWQKTLGQAVEIQRRFDYANSLPLLLDAERAAQAAHAPPRSTEDIYIYLGEAYTRIHQPQKAIASLNKGLKLNQLHEEDVLRANCNELLSDQYLVTSDYEAALEHANAAVNIASRQGYNMHRISSCHYSVASALLELNRNEEALAELEKSRDFAVKPPFVAKETPSGKLLNRFINYIGKVMANLGGVSNPELVTIDWALGNCYRRLGRDNDALKANSRALREWNEAVRGESHDQSEYMSRTIAFLGLGKYKETSVQAARWLELTGWRTENSPYAAIMLVVAYRFDHNDRAAEQVLLEYEQKKAPKLWPYPLIKYLAGDSTIDDLKKASGSNVGKLTETFAYVGLDSLAKGKPDEAKKYLRWVVDHGVPNYWEYQLATAFLERIGRQSVGSG